MKLPKARTENIVEQNLGAETLIYDLLINKAFNLNETSTIVYKACNGVTTFEEIRRKHKFSDEFIFLALDELKRNNLLAKETVYVSPFAETNRREIIKKVGLASMAALPIISGLVVPRAVDAASNADDQPKKFGEACPGDFSRRDCDAFSGYRCINGICCEVIASGSTLPGETYDFIDVGTTGTLFFPTDGTCDNPPSDICSSIRGGCCTGATPILVGNCEIETYYTDETETTISFCYVTNCTCACP